MANFFWTTTPDDTWHWGGYASREAALAAGRKEHPGTTIHTGILAPANALDMIPDGSDIVDDIRNNSGDHGDSDGDWLAYVSKEAKEDLGKRVQAVILAWLGRSRSSKPQIPGNHIPRRRCNHRRGVMGRTLHF